MRRRLALATAPPESLIDSSSRRPTLNFYMTHPLSSRSFKPSLISATIGLVSMAAAFSIVFRVSGAELLRWHQLLVVVFFCAAGLWFVVSPLVRQLLHWGQDLSTRARLLSVLLAGTAGVMWIFALPIDSAPNSVADITVTVLDEKAEQAQGREVWLRLERDGIPVPFTDLKQKGTWLDKAPFLVAANPSVPTGMYWSGSYSTSLRLIFISHAWSGRARVVWNGKQRDIDLYSANGGSVVLDVAGIAPTNSKLAFPERGARQWFTAACDALILGALTLALFAFLVKRPGAVTSSGAASSGLLREALLYSLPLVLTSVTSLLIFYPGLMTSDSLDQWSQAGNFAFNSAHPPLYGLFIVAIRSVWDSPAAVALVQAVLFAASCGWLIAVVRRTVDASSFAAWAAAWFTAIFPLLPLTAVTLWKDVPYTAAVIGLTAFVMSALLPGSSQRISVRAAIGLSLIMFCAMAMRHNGPPVAVAAALALFFIARKSRLRVLLALVGAVILMVLLKGPVSDAIGIERRPVSYVLYSHHIAAHLSAKHLPEAASDRALLHQLNTEQPDWAYSCATVNPTLFNPNFDTRTAAAHTSDLLRIWLELAAKRPDVEYDHDLCASGLIWRVIDSDSDPLYLSGVGLWAPYGKVKWITGKPGDPVPESKSPALAEFVGHMVLVPGMEAAFRPALFMYAFIFACAVAMVRRKDLKLSLLLFLPAVHTLFLAVSILAQDARYQLPLYAVALGTIPLLLAARRSSQQPSSAAAGRAP